MLTSAAHLLLTAPWHAAFFDEAHRLKNDRAKARAALLPFWGRPAIAAPLGGRGTLAGLRPPPPSLARSTPLPPACNPLLTTPPPPPQVYRAAMQLPTRLRYGLSGTIMQARARGGGEGGGAALRCAARHCPAGFRFCIRCFCSALTPHSRPHPSLKPHP